MKIRFWARACAPGLALAAVIGLAVPFAPMLAPDAPILATHARIAAHHDENGTLKRGLRNEVQTSNWSGYAIPNFQTGELYTQAQASWTVTKVSYVTPPPVCHSYRLGSRTHKFCSSSHPQWEYSSSWVGIGGYCEDSGCSSVDNTLIQLGTEQDASSSNSTEYYAWIEMLPNYPIIISPQFPTCTSLSCAYPVKPGDAITASLTCTANCIQGVAQTWLLRMNNTTQGWHFETSVNYASTLLSAEWIEEAPSSSAGVLPLADYGKASFDPTVNADAAPGFAPGTTDAILLVDPYGETSNPSVPELAPTLDAFNTCWGNSASNIAACPAP